MNNTRYEIIDHLKAVAVIMMVFFHLFFDLDNFGFVSIDYKVDTFWNMQPKIIIAIFLLSVGMSLRIVHGKGIKWRSFWKRFFKLAILALIISGVTYQVFPGRWVYMGIIHNIAITSLIGLLFLKIPRISGAVGAAIIFPSAFYDYTYPFISLSTRAVDHVAILPWGGFVLIGILLHELNFHKIKIKNYRGKKVILFLGQQSLPIYFIHQMILFPLCYLAFKLVN
jgi:uncharacterized membrane protein